jgi:hypothetical protein
VKKIYEEMHSSFDYLRSDYLQKYKLNDGRQSPGNGMSYKPPDCQYLEEDIMDIINPLAIEVSLPLKAYVQAYKTLSDSAWVRILLKMSDAGHRGWLLSMDPSSDN